MLCFFGAVASKFDSFTSVLFYVGILFVDSIDSVCSLVRVVIVWPLCGFCFFLSHSRVGS